MFFVCLLCCNFVTGRPKFKLAKSGRTSVQRGADALVQFRTKCSEYFTNRTKVLLRIALMLVNLLVAKRSERVKEGESSAVEQ